MKDALAVEELGSDGEPSALPPNERGEHHSEEQTGQRPGDECLMVATTYYFRVQLITSAGVDHWSQVVSALVN